MNTHTRVCVSLCTTVVHKTAQSSSDNVPSYPFDNHYSSSDRAGAADVACARLTRAVNCSVDLLALRQKRHASTQNWNGLTENVRPENDGPSKYRGMKMQDMKMQNLKLQELKMTDQTGNCDVCEKQVCIDAGHVTSDIDVDAVNSWRN